MTPISQSLTSTNGLLRVVFTWSDDRFAHVIEQSNANGGWRTLLRSREGTPSDPWPPSPPFQQLEPHIAGTGLTSLLAVGLAGTSHWSTSVEEILADTTETPEARLRFDVACRTKKPSDELTSSYSASGQSWLPYGGGVVLHTDFDGTVSKLVSDSAISIGGDSLAIRSKTIPSRHPTTARWSYDFLITSPATG